MDYHKIVTSLFLIIGLGFFGCGETYAYSENYNFLKDMTSALEHSGKAAVFIDQADLETDRFENQIEELNKAIALMKKYENTKTREIFDAKEAIRGSLINIREGNVDILAGYKASLRTNDADSLLDFEKIVKHKSKEITSSWKVLNMSVLHSSHVMLEHNKPYNSDSERLPFRINAEEKRFLKKRFDAALEVFNELEKKAGKNSRQNILALSQYVDQLQTLLAAETYGDVKEIQQTAV